MAAAQGVQQGTIKKLVQDKGFGFITTDPGSRDRSKDVFFHLSGMVERDAFDNLREGQQVSFTLAPADGGKGPRAENVKVV